MLSKVKSFIYQSLKPYPLLFAPAKQLSLIPLRIRILTKKTQQWFDRKSDEKKLMINIGGGHYFRRHWRVMECLSDWYAYSSSSIDYEFDLTSPAPFPLETESVSFFYSSHTLEHIPQQYCPHIFSEIYRCLKVDGVVRFTMPDYDLAYEAFKANSMDFFIKIPGKSICEKFLDTFADYMKDRVDPEELRKNFNFMGKEDFADFYTSQIPHEVIKFGNHVNWWNYEKLMGHLKSAGFSNVYRSKEQGSCFSEMKGRGINNGFDSTHPELSLFAEGIKKC